MLAVALASGVTIAPNTLLNRSRDMETRVMRASMMYSAVIACAAVTAASAQIQGTLSNFDVWNWTGQLANDFHVGLGGIPTTAIGGLYTGDYPSVTVANSGSGGTDLTWEGSTTAPGAKAHFGLAISGNLNPTSVQFNWTLNGNNIGDIPDAWQKWDALVSGIVRDDITNNSNQVLWVQRGVNTVPFGQSITLDDLLVGAPLWDSRSIVDPDLVPLFPGESLLYDFQTDPSTGAVVMMYEVFESDTAGQPGRPLLTFLNAAVVPAPGAPALALLAAGFACRRRR